MNETPDHNSYGAWLHALPMVVIAALALALWRPAGDQPPSPEQESQINDLAALLGSRPVNINDVDNRLQSFGPYPPEPQASRALAGALMICGTTGLDEPQRKRLARHLYGITVLGDSRTETVPAALLGIQQTAAAAGCSPAAIDELMRAARAVASTDPNPRRNWW